METVERRPDRSVAYRALCLGALLKRHQLEQKAQLFDPTRYEQYRHLNDKLIHWVNREALNAHLTTREQDLLICPFGYWSLTDMAEVVNSAERLGIVLWALSVLDSIPAYDTPFTLATVLRPLEIFTPVIDFVWCARQRPLGVLLDLRERAELWQWRAQAEDLQRMGLRAPDGQPLSQIIHHEAEQAQAQGKLPALIEGDFPVFGKPYGKLSSEQHSLTYSLSHARASTLNWLCEVELTWE